MDQALQTTGERIVHIKVQPLTAEAFKPYGSVLDFGKPIYPEFEAGKPVLFLSRLRRKPGAQRIETMATHFTYNQYFAAVKGAMVMIVAPPPRNRTDPFEKYEFDYDRAAAFIVEAGSCVDVAHGVWHSSLALGDEMTLMTGTRYDVDKSEFSAPESYAGGVVGVSVDKSQARMQKAIEHVDLRARDNCILEIVL